MKPSCHLKVGTTVPERTGKGILRNEGAFDVLVSSLNSARSKEHLRHGNAIVETLKELNKHFFLFSK